MSELALNNAGDDEAMSDTKLLQVGKEQRIWQSIRSIGSSVWVVYNNKADDIRVSAAVARIISGDIVL